MLENLILNKVNFIYFFISYFIGTIPFGYILFKLLKKKDIRNYGSGNIGATNVNRLLGKKLGAITLFLDFLKALLPTLLIKITFGNELAALCGFFCIVGHMFPIWLKFRGGKGVASFIGFLSVISWPLFVIFLFFWLIVVKIFKYSSLGAITAIIFNVIIFKLTLYIQFKYYVLLWVPGEPSEFYITAFVSFIILIKHTKNINTLLKG